MSYFELKVQIPAGSTGRNELGQLTSAQGELAKENRKLAEVLQADVVRYLKADYKRPNVSTGRLEKATADPANLRADQFGFGVGNVRFLDRSQAKYWRTIEEGSAATFRRGGMRGMELHGLFSNSITGFTFPRQQPIAARPSARGLGFRGAGYTGQVRSDPGRQGIFIPASKAGFYVHRHPNFVVKREIEPSHAYRRAFRDGRVQRNNIDFARRYIARVLARPLGPTSAL